MKIKVEDVTYEEMLARQEKASAAPRKRPKTPNPVLRKLVQALSKGELKKVNFTCEKDGMERLKEDEPCLILMNHSSFIDLEIAEYLFADRPFQIVCTSDGFVGKEGVLRAIGCIPTQKFVTDVQLVKDMVYAAKKLGNSILMYPEASYSFDGTATPLPKSIGKCVKLLGIPVVMVRTFGAFHRDPLYNGLQLRKVDVSAKMTYALSPEDIESKSAGEIQKIIEQHFNFDHFAWQRDNGIKINEPFRADYLNRVLYKCPGCLTEGKMLGKGIYLVCKECGRQYALEENGQMKSLKGDTEFPHIPGWYEWERKCVREEIEKGSYLLDIPVDICALVDMKSLCRIGEGRLVHNMEGFHLTGCDGKLDYRQKPSESYSLYADYYWYELGDMICIGNNKILYYCFPKEQGDVVAKTRLACEELYNVVRHR